jgi:hypothetical protein
VSHYAQSQRAKNNAQEMHALLEMEGKVGTVQPGSTAASAETPAWWGIRTMLKVRGASSPVSAAMTPQQQPCRV